MVTGEDGRNALAVATRISEQIQENIKKIPSIAAFYGVKESLQDSRFYGTVNEKKE
jgi:hypothetical protein